MFSYNSDKIVCISDLDVDQAKMILKSMKDEFQISHTLQTTSWDFKKMSEEIKLISELELAITKAEEKIREEVAVNEQG